MPKPLRHAFGDSSSRDLDEIRIREPVEERLGVTNKNWWMRILMSPIFHQPSRLFLGSTYVSLEIRTIFILKSTLSEFVMTYYKKKRAGQIREMRSPVQHVPKLELSIYLMFVIFYSERFSLCLI